MSRPIYLDYQATTPLDPRVAKTMQPYWSDMFGNPHSDGHEFGWQARHAVNFARSQVADLIGADDEEIVFVSGATESCNLAIRGVALAAGKRRHIVTVATEHPAVLETAKALSCQGFDVDVLPVDGDGLLDLCALENVLTEKTLLVSVMLANNEIGVIQPIREISMLCRSVGASVHTDATQAIGRIDVDVNTLDVDFLSLSAHKFYGPNGVGALYIRNGAPALNPILTGGTQERGLRPGTLPTPLIVGLGAACEIAAGEWQGDAKRLSAMTDDLRSHLAFDYAGMRTFGHRRLRVPGNLNVGFPGVLAERLVAATSSRLAISTGAACSSGSAEPSRVLLALGLSREIAATGVRISFGRFSTDDEVAAASRELGEALRAIGAR